MKLLVLFGCLVGLLSAFEGVACTCDQDKLAALEEQLAVQNNHLQLQNQQLTVQLTGLKEQLQLQNEQLQHQNEQLQHQNEQLQHQDEEIEALKKTARPRHEVEENQIAFSVASYDFFGPVTVDTNIPFPVVYTNVGDGWNPVINAFLVFKTGFYLFTASFRGDRDDSNSMYASIVHTTASGSQRIASLFSHNSIWASDANTAIIKVAVGDYVSVQLHGGSGLIGSFSDDIFSTFSGHLLFP